MHCCLSMASDWLINCALTREADVFLFNKAIQFSSTGTLNTLHNAVQEIHCKDITCQSFCLPTRIPPLPHHPWQPS